MPVTFEIEGLDALETAFDSLPDVIQGGVKLTGPATAYGLTWEWGRVDIKPGPKTLYSTNPDGEDVVLTIHAPHGWIRVNRNQYIQFLQEAAAKIKWSTLPPSQWPEAVKEALWDAAKKCAQLMEDTAPVDSGQLHAGIVAVNEPDPILDTVDGELDLGNL